MDYYSEGEESQEYFTPSEYYVLSQESFVSAESSFSSETEHSSQDCFLTSETDSSSQESCSSSDTETLTQQSSESDQSTQVSCTSSESDRSTQVSCTYSETDQQTQESHSSSRTDDLSQEPFPILGRVQDTQEPLDTSESEYSSQDYFDDLELYSDSESNVEDSFIAPARVYSSFLMRRPCDFISMKAPAPEGDYLWEVSLFPFHQVLYVNRNDRWRYAQVIFAHTLNRSDELFLDVVYVMDETYKYVSEHPECQSGPYNRKYHNKVQSKSILDEWDTTCNHFGVNSNYFWRKDNGCIWLRAPAPKEELFLEMALYNFDSVAGVRKEERWRFAKLNLSHSISTSGIIYKKLIPVVKRIYGLIMSHPKKIVNECQNIEGILL